MKDTDLSHDITFAQDILGEENPIQELHRIFETQKQAFLINPYPSVQERIELMERVPVMLRKYRSKMMEALHTDFGGHSTQQADLIEILGMFERAKYNIAHVKKWMQPISKEVNAITYGSSKAYIKYHPKGVIGNMVAWNFPFDIAIGPMLDQLGAGNRVIIKPSDLVPACGELLKEMISETFEENQVAVVTGDLEFAKQFPSLKWDHLVYTGNGTVAKEVMKLAAENLVPLTLELGGKNPVIVHEDSINDDTIAEIAGVKAVKRGQMCVTTDFCFVPEKDLNTFVSKLVNHFQNNFSENSNGANHCCGIINERHINRLQSLIEEAREAGVIVVQAGNDLQKGDRNMPFYVVVNPPMHLKMMQEEIFGPILPVISYKNIDEVISYINQNEKPLGLYIYGKDKGFINRITQNTQSGGISINALAMQAALPSMAFGGTSGSGMGVHHGEEGFREFSNPRGYFMKGKGGIFKTIMPPYSQETNDFIENVGYASLGKQAVFALKMLPKNVWAKLFS
ncbi:MAG: Coniferyl aldehyde dehydrogenase [Bacteroidota bacterium]